ncbi:MAG: hypothetical protein NZT61_04085, partial [Deltaproteobacteria bacterium]|nr:hypothetical protein [Deltaproteobacteria bacterium]
MPKTDFGRFPHDKSLERLSTDSDHRAKQFLTNKAQSIKAHHNLVKTLDDLEFLRWLAKVADSKLHGKGISKEELQQYLKTYNQLAKSKGKPQVTWDEKTFKALAERSGSPDHVNRRELYEMAGLKLNDRDCLKDERFLRYLIQNHYDKLCGYGISRGELNQIVNQYNRKHPNNQVRLYVETFEKISTFNGIEDRISKSELENHLGLQIRRVAEKDNKQSHLVVKKSYSALLHKPFVDFLRQQAIKNPPPEGQITEGFVQNMVAKYNQTSKDQVVFDSQSRSLFARLGEFNQDGNFVVHSSYLVRLYREIEARKKPIDQQRKREAMMTAYEAAQRVEELKTHEMATKPVEGGFLSWVFRSPVGVALDGLDSTGLSGSVFGTTLGRGAIQNDIRRLEKEVSEAIEDARAGKLTAVRYSSSEIANKEREIQNKIQLTQTAEVIGGGVLETVGLTALTVGTGGATTGALATRVGLNAAKVYGTLVSISAGGAVKTGVGFVNAVTSNNEYSLEQAKVDFAEGALMGLSGFGGARLAAKLEDKIDKLYPKLLTNADKIHRSTDETPARLGAVFARSSGDAGANFVDGFLQSIASGDLENSVKNGLTSAIFGSVVSLGVQGTLKAFRINNQVNQFVNQAAKNWTFEVEDQ